MPHHKHSTILPKNIMFIINDYIKPDKSQYRYIFDDCMNQLEYVKLIYSSYLYIFDGRTLLSTLRDKKINKFYFKSYQTAKKIKYLNRRRLYLYR